MRWNEPYLSQTVIRIVSTKNVINLQERYHPGSGDISVFVNGLLAAKDIDYIEASPWSLQFNFDLELDDTVVVQYQKLW